MLVLSLKQAYREVMDTNILENRNVLIEWMYEGCKVKKDWRIGTEHEMLGFCKETLMPLPYEGDRGIKALLEGLQVFGWQGIYENDILVGLLNTSGTASITLEPGGQLELSGATVKTIHHTYQEIVDYSKHVKQIASSLGQGFLGLGYCPTWDKNAAAKMPKSRYRLMYDYMAKKGSRGHDMMHLSCTVQVNLDFNTEQDMVEKFRIGLALQPLATALFSNSPFRMHGLSGSLSERSLLWLDADADRTGMLPFVFDNDFGFERYVDYALQVPMYFIIRDGQYIDAMGLNFRDFLEGKLPVLYGEKPTEKDWSDHLTTIFPEVRLKKFIEMRGADSGSKEKVCALSAFWVGLLYDKETQSQLADMIKDWTVEERQYLRVEAPVKGLATPFRGGTLLDIARIVLPLSYQGLNARACLNDKGEDETQYLNPLDKIVETGRNSAELLLDKFYNEWDSNVEPVFEEKISI